MTHYTDDDSGTLTSFERRMFPRVSAMIPAVDLSGETSESVANQQYFEMAVEDRDATKGLDPLEVHEGEEHIPDVEVLRNLEEKYEWLEAFIYGAVIADATDGKVLIDKWAVRRALFAVNSVKRTIDQFRKGERNRKAANRARNARRRGSKSRIDAQAKTFFEDDVDMRDLVEHSDKERMIENKAEMYDVLERMYRMARHRAGVADGQRTMSTRIARELRTEHRRLRNAYFNLKRKYEGEKEAQKWLERQLERDEKRKKR